ncbi:MAG TPA: type II secretion system protein GspC [Kofleriaceae bacterium]
MQDLIKRYFWVLGLLAVFICAVFAAKATSHIVEAKFLGDSDKAPRIAAMLPTAQPLKETRSKDGGAFATRNMFCSECTPPAVVANADPSQINTTSLPLVLLATMVSTNPKDSYATVINTETQKQGAYSVDDQLPGASGKLKEIHYKYVDFENNGHVERLVLAGATPPAVAAAPVQEQPASGEPVDDLQASIDNGIKKIDDNNYEIDKALVDKVLANPMGVAKGARVVPAVKNGKPDGFKLYAIRPSSVYAKLGLTNGDTLQSINGFELTSADKALEVYTKLREATSLEVEVTRRGKPMTLKYSIR